MFPLDSPRLGIALIVSTLLAAGCLGGSQQAGGVSNAGPLVNLSTVGLASSLASREVTLVSGAAFSLDARVVAHDPGTGKLLRMYAYNGEIPGPTLRVPQGANVTVNFTNRLSYSTTVHWHGVRVSQENDGVPDLSQAPVPPNGTFQYHLRFPDEGVYWYHPHVREDIQQDLGLAGAIIVDGPLTANETRPREVVAMLDDLLLESGARAPYHEGAADHALMGRYGNVFLVNGSTQWSVTGAPGERIRLHLLDVANARPFRIEAWGARSVQLIGQDGGFLRAPVSVTSTVLGPGERATLDIVLPDKGSVTLANHGSAGSSILGHITLRGTPVPTTPAPDSPHAHARDSIGAALARRTDSRVDVALQVGLKAPAMGGMQGMPGMNMGGGPTGPSDGIEWDMPASDAGMTRLTSHDVRWSLENENATSGTGMNATLRFQVGELARVRIDNVGTTHPMQHPIHLHGQRFIIEKIGDVGNPNPVWKDTVLIPADTSATILVDMSNPGTWVLHCHISEHLESGMELRFTVA